MTTDPKPQILTALHSVADFSNAPADNESLFDSGLLDSFTLNDLVLALESEFGITVPDADISARRFDSISKIAQYVTSKVK